MANPLTLASVPLIDGDIVKELINFDVALEAIEQAYVDYGRERRSLSEPPALLVPGRAGQAEFKIKGARVGALGVTGFRIIADSVSDGAERTIDYCWIADAASGRPIGLVDETWLHRLRTALTGVVAAKWLARPQSRVAAIIGAGKIAEELPGPLSAVFDIQEIRTVARRIESAESFAHRNQSIARITPFATVREAVKGADIVICITASSEPVLSAKDLEPGMFVCGLGGGPEISKDVLNYVDRFVIDDLQYAETIGSVRGWIESGLSRNAIAGRIDADIGEIVSSTKSVRQRDTDVVLAIVQGMACCDVALAQLVLARCGLIP